MNKCELVFETIRMSELVAVLSIVCDDPDPRSRLSRELVLVALLSRLVRLSDRCSPRRLASCGRDVAHVRVVARRSLEIDTKDDRTGL